jgi:propionyl-CoA synthetase
VLKAGVNCEPERLNQELIAMVRNGIGPIACYRETVIVSRLPKTRSGKILRGTMRAIAAGKAYRMPSTIDDPTSLEEISTALQKVGYPLK